MHIAIHTNDAKAKLPVLFRHNVCIAHVWYFGLGAKTNVHAKLMQKMANKVHV